FGIAQLEVGREIVVAPIAGTYKDRTGLLTAQVVARAKARPTAEPLEKLVVRHRQLMQFRPAVDLALHEPGCLQRLRYAIVSKVDKSGVPSPAAARQTELFAAVHVRRDAVLHQIQMTGAYPDEVALFQRVVVGDVADVDIQQAVSIDVGEVNSHPLEGVATED